MRFYRNATVIQIQSNGIFVEEESQDEDSTLTFTRINTAPGGGGLERELLTAGFRVDATTFLHSVMVKR